MNTETTTKYRITPIMISMLYLDLNWVAHRHAFITSGEVYKRLHATVISQRDERGVNPLS
jgi:hypothetical protein